MRELVYYVAASLDGFIADPAGDFSAFGQDPATLAALFERYPETCPAHVRAALGVDAPPRRFDTVLMGYRTFAPALDAGLTGGAYPHLRQVVATRRELPDGRTDSADPATGTATDPKTGTGTSTETKTDVETISGDVTAAVARLKAEPVQLGTPGDLWLCGGGDLAAQLVDLIDEIQVKVNPIAFGHGVPMLPAQGPARSYDLARVEPLPGGVVLLTYRRP